MRPKNGRLVVLVAAVAVAAVVIGGVLAYSRGPRDEQATAAPLARPTPTPAVSKTPSTTPASTPTATPSGPAYTGRAEVTLKLSKLPKGRVPQIPYLVGREVRGGAGTDVKIPGTQQVFEFARLGERVLAVVIKGNSTELMKIGIAGDVERVPDVATVVTTEDETAAAYSAQLRRSDGANLRGGIVYAETGADGQVHKLDLPKAWEVQVLAYAAGKVWFRASDKQDAAAWSLYTWIPGETTPTLIKTVASPTALSPDATIAASRKVSGDYGTCSTVNEVATGKQLWRTCEYGVRGFTQDGNVAIGGPAYEDGYGPGETAALDAKTGNLLRKWNGATFLWTVVEDDQHFLMVVDDGPETPRGVIRCTIPTGSCEQALPLTKTEVMLGK